MWSQFVYLVEQKARPNAIFDKPMIWSESTNHCNDWYFGCINVFGFSTETKHKILHSVLLHNENEKPIDPNRACCWYEIKTIKHASNFLSAIRYDKYKWSICSDMKVTNILPGMQNIWCFMCRYREKHHKTKTWPSRHKFEPGKAIIEHKPLVDPTTIVLPTLHIKLGLILASMILKMELMFYVGFSGSFVVICLWCWEFKIHFSLSWPHARGG